MSKMTQSQQRLRWKDYRSPWNNFVACTRKVAVTIKTKNKKANAWREVAMEAEFYSGE